MDEDNIIKPYPDYSYPTYLLLNLIRDIFLGRRRSFRADSVACLARLIPPLRVSGMENIPSNGPCLLTFNHYSRQGFHAWWNALAIAAQLPIEAHIIMTSELTFPGKWYAPAGKTVSRWLLKRITRIYGFSSMPPMPPRDKDVAARARAVRAVLSFVKRTANPVVCLAPEGGDTPGGRLAFPPSGSGRFILHLAGNALRVFPIGVWEQEGCLCVNFGVPFTLSIPKDLPADEKDRAAARSIMENIALLLPSHLRGEFQ
jgi:1-acyl-sn-glycerol-3-phosphate acyltransferase